VLKLSRLTLPLLVLSASACLPTLGCRAQNPLPGGTVTVGQPLPPALAFRVEALLRRKSDLPPEATINLGNAQSSNVPGFSKITVSVADEGHTSRPIEFLISADGKTLEQVNTYDIAADPRDLVSDTGRPARGGPETAPVLIVGFDDLECPFCARLNTEIFPALTRRYGDKVRIVYRDFPIDQHPWAMHAAVDVNCLAAQSPDAYWSAVDAIHAHASDFGEDPKDAKADKTLQRADEQLDAEVRQDAQAHHLDMTKLDACVAKQDTANIEASKRVGDALNLSSTPTLFINGEKIEGAVSLSFLYQIIDTALRAEGVTPPPPYVAPAPPAPPTPPKPATPAKS
jgi:protein-disulfide isomerase